MDKMMIYMLTWEDKPGQIIMDGLEAKNSFVSGRKAGEAIRLWCLYDVSDAMWEFWGDEKNEQSCS